MRLVGFFGERPDTTFVTISRPRCAWVNKIAVQTLFAESQPLTWVDGDPESNPDNFRGVYQVSSIPMRVPVFKGMRVTLTRNINKHVDYVNGQGATVLGAHALGVRVRTDTGYIVMVYPWTDDDRNTFLPMRLGYATTLLKVQGATLAHMTIWLDVPNVEAAGYVALSRVRKDWQS